MVRIHFILKCWFWHVYACSAARAPSQYPKRRLSVRSRKVSKPRDWYFKLSYRFEIWLAHRQHCCRSACQISEQSDNYKYKSRGFETLRDLTERRLFGYWDGAQVLWYNGNRISKWLALCPVTVVPILPSSPSLFTWEGCCTCIHQLMCDQV